MPEPQPYVIEWKTPKGWEICYEAVSLTEAVNKFRDFCLRDDYEYRLTTPER